ncbi:MAG: ArnT family glycosyltransferase [Vicinamibacterales bacterium]
MTLRRSLWIVCLVATLHGVFFIWYQRPDWTTQWSDQEGYRRLGQVLAETGKFTRFPDAPTFVPEVLRTPLYPLFVAVLFRAFGVHQLPVALAQTFVFALICVVVYAMARRVTSEPVAIGAAAATALFSPIPYFGALVMTEVLTTLLFTLSMWVAVSALADRRFGRFAWLGVLLALTTLSRPVFVLFPFALATVGLVLFPLVNVQRRPRFGQWSVMIAAFALTMAPWFTYNYVTLGRFALSPAGGVGRGLWEGSWQATWTGRLQNELTHLADDIDDRAELDRRVAAVADRERLPVEPMLEYVHQWEDIRLIWTEPSDPLARAVARVTADQEYGRVAMANIRRDTAAHLGTRLARGLFILWAGEIPFRYSGINALSTAIIRACWTIQAVIFLVALWGGWALCRSGRMAQGLLLLAPILYISAVHFPLLTEARQSLPAQPTVLMLAALGIAGLTRHSLPLEAQVHEREHL